MVDVDWSDAAGQMKSILGYIADYQPLVDRNLQVANEYADWSKRMPLIIKILEGAGYKV